MPLHCSLYRESSGLESNLEDVGGGVQPHDPLER